MILRTYPFKRVTIIGVGLMGGSMGLAIKKHRLAREVTGLSNRQSSLVQAIKMKAIDTAVTDVAQAVRNADLVILATTVDSIISFLSMIKPHLKRNCVVTDLGSAKAEIVDEAEKIFEGSSFQFVGSHPLVGSEKKGVSNARADLFENALCVITPTEKTHRHSKEKIKKLWASLGARIKYLGPEEHDEILSYISHLPHLAAFGLMGTVPEKILQYSSQGLKDTTRIAGSSPEMWSDICMANAKNVIRSLDEYVLRLAQMRKAIVSRDKRSLIHHFTKAKEKRDTI